MTDTAILMLTVWIYVQLPFALLIGLMQIKGLWR